MDAEWIAIAIRRICRTSI